MIVAGMNLLIMIFAVAGYVAVRSDLHSGFGKFEFKREQPYGGYSLFLTKLTAYIT